jgi:hypothetical protein
MSDSTIEANNLIGDQWVRGIGDAFERRTPAGDRVVCEGYQASIEQIKRVNKISKGSLLKKGARIKIPVKG